MPLADGYHPLFQSPHPPSKASADHSSASVGFIFRYLIEVPEAGVPYQFGKGEGPTAGIKGSEFRPRFFWVSSLCYKTTAPAFSDRFEIFGHPTVRLS
jgi:hypothetical protein